MSQKYLDVAKKRVRAKMVFYISAIIFLGVSVLLVMLSFYWPYISFWLRFPIPILAMVLAIMYLFAFGPFAPAISPENWREEEIEKGMRDLYRQRRSNLPSRENLSETDILELKELELLQNKWCGDGVEYV